MLRPLYPIRAVLLAGATPLFLGALLSDVAYFLSFETQWKNFASWLLVGALVFCGVSLIWAVIELFRVAPRTNRHVLDMALLLVLFVLGIIDALVHTRDAWASMPTGLILSVILAALSMAATWAGFSRGYAVVRS